MFSRPRVHVATHLMNIATSRLSVHSHTFPPPVILTGSQAPVVEEEHACAIPTRIYTAHMTVRPHCSEAPTRSATHKRQPDCASSCITRRSQTGPTKVQTSDTNRRDLRPPTLSGSAKPRPPIDPFFAPTWPFFHTQITCRRHAPTPISPRREE